MQDLLDRNKISKDAYLTYLHWHPSSFVDAEMEKTDSQGPNPFTTHSPLPCNTRSHDKHTEVKSRPNSLNESVHFSRCEQGRSDGSLLQERQFIFMFVCSILTDQIVYRTAVQTFIVLQPTWSSTVGWDTMFPVVPCSTAMPSLGDPLSTLHQSCKPLTTESICCLFTN